VASTPEGGHGAHLLLHKRQALLQRPARRRQLLGALRDLVRALLADDRLFFLLELAGY
jgi:hypothetical protein